MTQPAKSGNNQRKIAFCLPAFHFGGEGDASFLLQMLIAQKLIERGQQIRFIAPIDQEDVICTTDPEQKNIVRRTWSSSLGFRLLRKASWKMQQILRVPYLNFFSNFNFYDAYLQCLPGVDLVQERNGLYRMAAAMAARRLKLPYILFFDADDLYEHDYLGDPIKGVLRWRAEQMMRYNLRAAQRVICVSKATKQRLVNVWQTPAEKIEVFPNAVDVDVYRESPDSRQAVRASFGLQDQPLVIFVGGFYPWHDVQGLLTSFEMIARSHPEARLMLVGDGPQHQAMEAHAAGLGISAKVIFTGRVAHKEVPRLIGAADIAVAPYPQMDRGAFWFSPMKLFEYMACGKAIVASDLGQIADAIQDGQSGLLVQAGSSAALAGAITRLIEDQSLRFCLGEQARRTAVENYSWEQYMNRLTGLYAQVIAEFSTHAGRLK